MEANFIFTIKYDNVISVSKSFQCIKEAMNYAEVNVPLQPIRKIVITDSHGRMMALRDSQGWLETPK